MRFKKRRGIISPFLIGLPLIVMLVSIALSGKDLQGTNASIVQCNQNNIQPGNSCSIGGSVTYTCPVASQLFPTPCGICAPGVQEFPQICNALPCPSPPPPPSYCSIIGKWLLPAGSTLTVNQNVVVGQETSALFLFGIGNIGPSGYIFIIGLVIGIFVLAGLTIFGTGSSIESLHILFMGGMFMAIWLLLSTLDGFITSNPNSIFTQLNKSFLLVGLPVGTSIYVLLTFLYLMGFVGMVKRGG